MYASSERLILARGLYIFESVDDGSSWQRLVDLPISIFVQIIGSFSILRRLFRLGVHHVSVHGNEVRIFVNKKIVTYSSKTKDVHVVDLIGSRPLSICQNNLGIYYGQYSSNPNRDPINIWHCKHGEREWNTVKLFENVRHIHGVFWDKYTKSIWVTTGDSDTESGIWQTQDDFKTINKVLSGSQQTRVVQLLFDKSFIYFGTDTPQEQNFIYRMSRSHKVVDRLQAVGSSVFYGCQIDNSMFFSTAVEPSDVNKSQNSEVWRSDNGINWYLFKTFKKDILSMKYFQYGQVLFPNGGLNKYCVYYTPFSTKNHEFTLKTTLDRKITFTN